MTLVPFKCYVTQMGVDVKSLPSRSHNSISKLKYVTTKLRTQRLHVDAIGRSREGPGGRHVPP